MKKMKTDKKTNKKTAPRPPVDPDRVLTRDRSEQLDFTTLAGRPEVDAAENERSLSGVPKPQTFPEHPKPDSRPERVHQLLPDQTPNVP